MADSLEDDFVVDELVALSDEEQEFSVSEEEALADNNNERSPNDRTTAEKKRKRREKFKQRKAKKRKLVEAADFVEHSIADQSPHDLAQYISSMQARTFTNMSTIELEDMQIPESSIADTTIWTGPRTLDQLTDFIIKVLPSLRTRLSQKSKANGSPTLIFVTGAALRVADVTRVLKDKRLRGEKGGEVAKLFAKHFKLSEHVAYLRRTKICSAVGTPGRLGKLICETDALTVSALSHIMLDVTFRDAKKRSLLDIPETRDEVFKTVLGVPRVLQGIKEGKIQVVLF